MDRGRPLTCPKCFSYDVRRSHRKGVRDYLFSLMRLYPFRCTVRTELWADEGAKRDALDAATVTLAAGVRCAGLGDGMRARAWMRLRGGGRLVMATLPPARRMAADGEIGQMRSW